jgi:hypothetical protein
MTTYYVRVTGGSNGNAGTSFGAAWATVQHGLDTVTAGDQLRICADGVHSTSSEIDLDASSGTSAAPIEIVGANATGTIDGTRATIQASSSMTNLMDVAGGCDYTRWRHLNFDANSNAAIGWKANSGSNYHTLYDCRVYDTSTSNGVYLLGGITTLASCEIYGCDRGVRGANAYNVALVNCSIHDNTTDGVYANNNSWFMAGCVVYDNGGDGWELSKYDRHVIINNVFHGNGGDGIGASATGGEPAAIIAGNIFAANGAYGVSFGSARPPLWMDYNHFDSNTSGETDLGSTPGDYNTSGDPLFVSTTDGSEDFTIKRTSPAYRAGMTIAGLSAWYGHIGAVVPMQRGILEG